MIYLIMPAPEEKSYRHYKKPKVDKQLRGVKNASLNLSFKEIKEHCMKIAKQGGDLNRCVDLNCYFQEGYVECFDIFRSREECIEHLRKDIEQMGGYNFSQVKLWEHLIFYSVSE